MLTMASGILTETWQYAVLSVFMMAIGLWLIVVNFREMQRRQRYYTEKVIAVCTHIDTQISASTSRNGSKRLHCPHYSFEYQGQKYYVKSSSYSNISIPKLGASVFLYINPDDPNQFYRKGTGQNQFPYVVGGIFLAFGLKALLSLF